MRIIDIKKEIDNMVGKEVKIKEYIGRNKYESFSGSIYSTYPRHFIVKTKYENKSFTYTDVLTKNINITLK